MDENAKITYQGNSIRGIYGIYGGQLRITSGSYNWSKGLEYNVTSTAVVLPATGSNFILLDEGESKGVLLQRSSTGTINYIQYNWGYDLATGKYLWNNTWVQSAATGLATGTTNKGLELYMFIDQDTGEWIAVNARTGYELWRIPNLDDAWGTYGLQCQFASNGLMLTTSYAGVVRAWDPDVSLGPKTPVWTFKPPTPYLPQSPSGSWFGGFGPAANGIVTFNTLMSWPHGILERGHGIWALNENTGVPIWNITGWYNSMALADGYIIANNLYENRIYCIGIGPSATTVTAPEITQTIGTPVLIKGSVTDQTPSLMGTAAASDESMSSWMEHLVQQKPIPADFKGVEVKLSAIDPNNNYCDIGTATTDANGFFSFLFNPEISGKYNVKATFEGNGGYGSSFATTAFGITEAPAVTPPPTQQPIDFTQIYIPVVGVGIAILVAIAIAVILILRKP